MNIYDVRAELPTTDWEIGRHLPKISRTYHWNGPALPTDVDPLDLIRGDASFHVSKDWSPAPGIQGGDGIMYHKLIARNGDLYITRNEDAVLWACGDDLGNRTSEHVQVMIGRNDDGTEQQPTVEQLSTMTMLERVYPLGATFPHGPKWSPTACPGETVRRWISAAAWKKEEVNEVTEQDKVWIEQLLDAKLVAVEQRLNAKIDSGFNTTLTTIANRIVAGDKDTATERKD